MLMPNIRAVTRVAVSYDAYADVGLLTSVIRWHQGASTIGRYARHGPTASEYCLAIVFTIWPT